MLPSSYYDLSLSLSLSHVHHLEEYTESNKQSSIGIIIGATIGGTVLLLLLLLAGFYAFHQKRRAEKASDQLHPFGKISMT